MKLVVDENIPAARDTFGRFGSVSLLPGRRIDAAAVREADILLVRSVTPVDAALLAGSRVRFVATATAGIDHVDTAWLAKQGIAFASAPGSNADSVVDYVLAAMAHCFPDEAPIPAVGIVGCGEVGGRLLRRLRALGIGCRVFDPFVHGIAEAASLESVLACGVITLHVPLTREGPHPTWHLLDAARLARLAEDALLINAARGEVVDNAALLAALTERSRLRAVLDVWEPEPELDPRLLARCTLGTPHIAGYALDGKLRGVAQVHAALCAFLGVQETLVEALALPPAGTLDAGCADWKQAALRCYDLRADDERLRAAVSADPGVRGAAFDRLRREYPVRREFSGWRLPPALTTRAALRAAGFGS
jgi:erythronate-4-phosphate dehydrogenase